MRSLFIAFVALLLAACSAAPGNYAGYGASDDTNLERDYLERPRDKRDAYLNGFK